MVVTLPSIKRSDRSSISAIVVVITSLIASSAVAQDASTAASTIERKVLTKVRSDAPVRGYRISPSDIGDNGHNFEYCNGSTGKEDLSLFSPIGETCESAGWAMSIQELQEGLEGATVYYTDPETNDYVSAGRIVVFGGFGNADSTVGVEFTNVEPPDGMIVVDLQTDGLEVIRSREGDLSILLDAEIWNSIEGNI